MNTLPRRQAVTRVGIIAGVLAMAALPCVAKLLVAYGDDDHDVRVYDVETRRHTNLTNHPASDAVPSWSGDGRHIAFWSNRAGTPDIYTMKADGSDLRRRSHSVRGKGAPAFSPSGRYIAYPLHSGRDGMTPIKLVDTRTGDDRIVTAGTGLNDIRASWFPDNDRILFSRRGAGPGIYHVRIDGKVDEEHVSFGYDPAMGPDGRSIAYRPTNWFGADNEIHIRNLETGESRLIPIDLPDLRQPLTPTWVARDRLLVADTQRDVFLVNVATGAHEALPLSGWVSGFDTAHPWDVSARGKKPFMWGWLKSLGGGRR